MEGGAAHPHVEFLLRGLPGGVVIGDKGVKELLDLLPDGFEETGAMVLQIIGAGESRIWSISIGWSSRPSIRVETRSATEPLPWEKRLMLLTKYSRSSAYRVRGGGRDLQVGNRRYGLFGCHAGNNRVGGVHLVGDGIELRTDIGKELLELPIPVFVDFIAGHLF